MVTHHFDANLSNGMIPGMRTHSMEEATLTSSKVSDYWNWSTGNTASAALKTTRAVAVTSFFKSHNLSPKLTKRTQRQLLLSTPKRLICIAFIRNLKLQNSVKLCYSEYSNVVLRCSLFEVVTDRINPVAAGFFLSCDSCQHKSQANIKLVSLHLIIGKLTAFS